MTLFRFLLSFTSTTQANHPLLYELSSYYLPRMDIPDIMSVYCMIGSGSVTTSAVISIYRHESDSFELQKSDATGDWFIHDGEEHLARKKSNKLVQSCAKLRLS